MYTGLLRKEEFILGVGLMERKSCLTRRVPSKVEAGPSCRVYTNPKP